MKQFFKKWWNEIKLVRAKNVKLHKKHLEHNIATVVFQVDKFDNVFVYNVPNFDKEQYAYTFASLLYKIHRGVLLQSHVQLLTNHENLEKCTEKEAVFMQRVFVNLQELLRLEQSLNDEPIIKPSEVFGGNQVQE